MGVIWAYGVIWVYLLFRFKTDRKLKISIHASVGVEIYAFRSSLSGVKELFDNFYSLCSRPLERKSKWSV